jgi:CMP-N-acetylneuraminic acid synthetase
MIPARLGSQRLKQKNLKTIQGKTLIELAISKAKNTGVFDEVWVNSESDLIGEYAMKSDAGFHKRPDILANNVSTSEDFVYEFLKKHDCDILIQLHSIAPLISQREIKEFVNYVKDNDYDVVLSCEDIQIECVYENEPVNFILSEKTNSQDLKPVKKVSWSITAWRKDMFINSYEKKHCATYSGNVGYFSLNKLSSHVIKTQEDLEIADSLYNFIK